MSIKLKCKYNPTIFFLKQRSSITFPNDQHMANILYIFSGVKFTGLHDIVYVYLRAKK